MKERGDKMKFKEIGVALFLALAVLMAFNVVMVRAVLVGDVNHDHVVDIGDATAVGVSFGKQLGDAGYNPDADVNGNNQIDVFDLVMVAIHYGESEPAL